MTPRERAEAEAQEWYTMTRLEVKERLEKVLTEHVRALLADDEATIEVMAQAIGKMDEEMTYGCDSTKSGYGFLASAALAALRRKAGI
jgi:hypothetical protein